MLVSFSIPGSTERTIIFTGRDMSHAMQLQFQSMIHINFVAVFLVFIYIYTCLRVTAIGGYLCRFCFGRLCYFAENKSTWY